jgi:hypothetical protein
MIESSYIEAILQAAGDALEAAGYRGKDPYQLDHVMTKASGNRLLRPFIGYARKALKPFHTLIPRRLFELSKDVVIPQALGDSLSAEAHRTDIRMAACRATTIVALLDASRTGSEGCYGWGLPFAWGGGEPHSPHWPTIITTTIIINGFLDALPLLGEEVVKPRVDAALRFMVETCGYEETPHGICLRYCPGDTRLILNINAAGAWALARGAELLARDDYIALAKRMMALVVHHQNMDGSWHYAPEHKEHKCDTIIDSRHTGYILESLAGFARHYPDAAIENAITRGWDYNITTLMDGDAPRSSPSETYPIDSHDVAQAIQTALALGKLDWADRLVVYAMRELYRGDGLFCYKRFADGSKHKANFIRWTQAPMYRAFAIYCAKRQAA